MLISTLALFGSSPQPDSDQPSSAPGAPNQATPHITHHFDASIDGGSVELTLARPSATYDVTIVVKSRGPGQVDTTQSATLNVHAAISMHDVAVPPPLAGPAGADVAAAAVLRFPGGDELTGTDAVALDLQHALLFSGDCDTPESGTCRAQFQVELRRTDDGERGGTLTTAWSFDVNSVAVEASSETSELTSVPPPWTFKVTGP